jgi:hypothetical protein
VVELAKEMTKEAIVGKVKLVSWGPSNPSSNRLSSDHPNIREPDPIVFAAPDPLNGICLLGVANPLKMLTHVNPQFSFFKLSTLVFLKSHV